MVCKPNANRDVPSRHKQFMPATQMSPSSPAFAGNDVTAGLPVAAWRLLRFMAIIGALSLLLLVAAHVHGSRMLSASQSTSSTPVRMVIGGEVLSIAENMIRRREDRQSGLASSIDLQLLWPEMTGFTAALAPRFADTDPETAGVVLVSIANRISLVDMRTRYEPVYRSAVLPGSSRQLAAGLVVETLDPAYGYIDEEVVHAPSDGVEPAFVARCQKAPDGAPGLVLACQADVFFGDALEARIRFARHQLDDWRQFSDTIDAFLAGLIVDR